MLCRQVWAVIQRICQQTICPFPFPPCHWLLDIDAFTCGKSHAHKKRSRMDTEFSSLGANPTYQANTKPKSVRFERVAGLGTGSKKRRPLNLAVA
jgi:hypothetical protein